ncbi:DUF3574 domain-containing protein [Tychonema sp. LEGE 07203]|uniref:DUF3574 domain-containing protein n=1 Tax=Tychonema sp. LEGE 07203 TaxID=1828671 RepID=UPI00187EE80C|nr:DUF3574 domain-containing protein [Tychonema sp. LEGE 07203]MBE9095937.1 DUF3574 domain-containing protein [Tychonema sp. LEGE 07203]
MNKHLHSLCLTGLLLVLPVFPATIARAQLPETSETKAQQTNFLKDELYFGLTKPGGEIVSESEWQEFVKAVITPRFREGLTVLDGSGQFLNSSGILIREKSKIVILIYQENSEKNRAVQEIIETYKRRFQQESVLRTTSQVKVSF